MATRSSVRPFRVHSFAGGVLSRSLDSRADIERYAISARTLHNVQVMRNGSACNRAGFEVCGPVKAGHGAVRLLEWRFDDDDRYVIEMGAGYFRLWQDGGVIVTPGTSSPVLNKPYSPGDIVWAAGSVLPFTEFYCKRAVNVTVAPASDTANWLELELVDSSPALVSIFEIPTPYTEPQLFDVRMQQSGDVTWLVHPSHPVYELRRTGNTSWTMLPARFRPPLAGPLNLAATSGSGTDITDFYKVTAVKRDTFEESLPGSIAVTWESSAALSGGTGVDITVTHDGVNNIGTSAICVDVLPFTATKNPAFEAALLNRLFAVVNETGTTFDLDATDGLTVPAGYRATFITVNYPDGKVIPATTVGNTTEDCKCTGTAVGLVTGEEVAVLFAGSGTTQAAFEAIVGNTYTVTVISATQFTLNNSKGIDWSADVGTIYLGRCAIEDTHGPAQNVTLTWDAVPGAEKYYVYKKLNGVFGYRATTSEPTFVDDQPATAGAGAGTSDTPPIFYNPFSGVGKFPSVVGMHDQRLCFGGTNDEPAKFWLSRTNDFLNFTHSSPFKDDDAINATIIGAQELRHFLDLDKLVAVSNAGIYFIESDESGLLVPEGIGAKRRGSVGASGVAPLIIDDSVLFVQNRNTVVRDFRLDAIEFQKGRDLSVFARSLMDGHAIVDRAYQAIPESTIWWVRDDGVLLGHTYVREQEINALHTHDTGRSGAIVGGDPTQDTGVESVAVIPEDGEDRLYAVVNRTINPTYEYGAKYEPPLGMIAHCCAHSSPGENNAFFQMFTRGVPDMTQSTSNVAGGGGSNVLITSVAHGFYDGQVLQCVEVYSTAGLHVQAFVTAMRGNEFTVTAKTDDTFQLASTTTITVPANWRASFIVKGPLKNGPVKVVENYNIGGNGHGSFILGDDGAVQTSKALSGGGGVNIRITTATPPALYTWVRIDDVEPSAGPADPAFEALLEGNDYLVVARLAANWFEIGKTSAITVPVTQQCDFTQIVGLPGWPGQTTSVITGVPIAKVGPSVQVTSATTPVVGQFVMLADTRPSIGVPQTVYETAVEVRTYQVATVNAGVSFTLAGTGAFNIPANQIADFVFVDPTGNPVWWIGVRAETYVAGLAEGPELNAIPQITVTLHNETVDPPGGASWTGADVPLDTGSTPGHPLHDQYLGIVAQLNELGKAVEAWNKPMFLCIAPECNSPHNGYDRDHFASAFAKARAKVRATAGTVPFGKVAVLMIFEVTPTSDYEVYYPGNEFIDYGGFDIFEVGQGMTEGTTSYNNGELIIKFFEGKHKPLIINEVGCVGPTVNGFSPGGIAPDAAHGGDDATALQSATDIWYAWWRKFLDYIDARPSIKYWHYINRDHSDDPEAGAPLFWFNARIDINKFLMQRIVGELREGRHLGADQKHLLKSWAVNEGLTAEPEGPDEVRYIERMRVRKAGEDDHDVKLDSFFVDSGLTWDGRNAVGSDMAAHVATTLVLSGGVDYAEGEFVTLTASASLFVAADEGVTGFTLIDPMTGDEVNVTVMDYTSATVVIVQMEDDATPGLFEGEPATSWVKRIGTMAGFEYLEGRILNVLGDGQRQPTVLVADGEVVFQGPHGIIQIGLPIAATIDTLDFDAPESGIAGQPARAPQMVAVVHNTRGARAGPVSGDELFPLEQTPVDDGSNTSLFTGKAEVKMHSDNALQTSIRIRMTDPLPMLVEGIIPVAEVSQGG